MIVFDARDDVDFFKSLQAETEIHPHCFNDLVHKATLYFQAQSVRLPCEAQKRVSSTMCSWIGLKPANEAKYHLFPDKYSDKYLISPEDEYFQNTDLIGLWDPKNHKIENTGQEAIVRMALFRQKRCILTDKDDDWLFQASM
jgi:hypothetical protein